MKLSLIPVDKRFFALFEQSADNAVRIAQQLKDMLYIWENLKERVKMISDLEHQGDAINHQVVAGLYRTFLIPFDQEDITTLARSLDDIADFVHSAADALLIYKIERPTDRAKELADILVQTVTEVERAVSEMRYDVNRHQLLKRCIEINRLENTGDHVYRQALAELFAQTKDMNSLIKWREIYKNMESAIDKCEDVANILEGIALKYT